MSCGVGGRHSSDPTLLWLCHRPAAAAPIHPLAWELTYASSVALKKKKKQNKKPPADLPLFTPKLHEVTLPSGKVHGRIAETLN